VSREVILYTRRQCGLCDETAAELRRLRDELRFELRELDIDEDADLRERYNDVVPVVAVGERVIAHAPIDAAALRKSLIDEIRG
jgi:glutaredoxin